MDSLIGIAVIFGGFAVIYLIANILGRDGKDPNNVAPDSEKPLHRVMAVIRPVWRNLLRKRGLWWRVALWAAAGIAAVPLHLCALWMAALVARFAIPVSNRFYRLTKTGLAKFGLWGQVALWVTTAIMTVTLCLAILWTAIIVVVFTALGVRDFYYWRLLRHNSGTLTDARDGKTYKTIKVGRQTWMAENLNYRPQAGNSWCYDDNNSNCGIYGRLYDWNTARTVCSPGWNLPSNADWGDLEGAVRAYQGKNLKAGRGWNRNSIDQDGNGTDFYGFSALPGGFRDSVGRFNGVGSFGYWWTATESGVDSVYYRYIDAEGLSVQEGRHNGSYGLSVRCVADARNPSVGQSKGVRTWNCAGLFGRRC